MDRPTTSLGQTRMPRPLSVYPEPPRPQSQMAPRSDLQDTDLTPRFSPLKKVSISHQSNAEVQTERGSSLYDPPYAFDRGTQIENTFYRRLINDMTGQHSRSSCRTNESMRNPRVITFADPPMVRQGRVGSGWRHMRQCRSYLGNTIMYIDGSVKENDCRNYPPHGLPSSTLTFSNIADSLTPYSSYQSFYQMPRLSYTDYHPIPNGSRRNSRSYQDQYQSTSPNNYRRQTHSSLLKRKQLAFGLMD